MTEKQIRYALELNYRWSEKKFDDFFKGHKGAFTDDDYNRAVAYNEKLDICADRTDSEVMTEYEIRNCGNCRHHKKSKSYDIWYCANSNSVKFEGCTGKEDYADCDGWERKKQRNSRNH